VFARVALETPLPGLDRLFDYLVPDGVNVSPGVRVSVPFGNSSKTGFVVSISETSDWTGKISEVTEVVSEFQALKPQIYELVRAVADRQAASFGDVIGSAIPVRAVRAEKAWFTSPPALTRVQTTIEPLLLPQLSARLVEPRHSIWLQELCALASSQLAKGKSAIICLPDFRDIARLKQSLDNCGLSDAVIDYSAQGRTDSYQAFLEAWHCDALGAPRIVIGSRNAIFAPVEAGGIYIWDDGDQSHVDQGAPYASTRELALIRQKLSGADLAFLSHTRSVEVQRLVSIGYLKEASAEFPKPQVASADGQFRVDSAAWLLIREGLKTGPVLVQVSSVGVAKSLFCSNCDERARCGKCNGPLWINQNGQTTCRWCNAFELAAKCHKCSNMQFRFGKPGSTRTAAEFGKSFPGTKVLSVVADEEIRQIDASPQIVVATPGIEPIAIGGYSAVVILDANDALAKDSLRAVEDATRNWANAISLMSSNGRAVIVGIVGDLATAISLWQLREISARELDERIELKFPPAFRVLSATGSKANIQACRERFSKETSVEILGQTPTTEGEERLIVRFSYSAGVTVTGVVRELQLQLASGQKRYNPKSGRATRPVTFKMDDPQVL
jgi:primosomal protein N' (replication factor Y)